jgi:hypothetical protein
LLDQSVLELKISTQSKLTLIAASASETWENGEKDVEMNRDIVRRMCFIGEITIDEREDWEIDLEIKLKTWQDEARDEQSRQEFEVWVEHEAELKRLKEEADERVKGAAVVGRRHKSEVSVEDDDKSMVET